MKSLSITLLLVTSLWGQLQPASKCGFAISPHAVIHETRSGERDIPQFDEALLDESIVSPAGHFRVHFTRSGTHAVADGGSTGTPEFVLEAALAADSSYRVIINDLGFMPPLADGGIDGDELDIYIRDWNGTFYGMTYFGNSAPSQTYLVIDNDYTESGYATHGLAAMRVTIAHEFFHMVQLRYAYPFDPVSSNAYWYEISSTWMEERCYPEVNDYHAYVGDNFSQSTFPSLNDDRFGYTFAYGHGLFGQILDMEYGTAQGKHIMLDIWEGLSGREATDNLEQVLSSSPWGSSLTHALGKYALYNVFTGSRSISGAYYPDAAELPEVYLHEYDLPELYPDTVGIALQAFGIAFKRFNIPTYADFFIRADDITNDEILYLTVHSIESGSSLKSALGDYWTSCNKVSSQDYLVLPMINGSREDGSTFTLRFEGNTLPLEDAIQTLWPNPTIPRLALPQISYMIKQPGEIQLSIYNLRGQLVYRQNKFRAEGLKLEKLPIPINSPAGVYFVQLVSSNLTLTRKFTVLP